jgi:hypothetical protein
VSLKTVLPGPKLVSTTNANSILADSGFVSLYGATVAGGGVGDCDVSTSPCCNNLFYFFYHFYNYLLERIEQIELKKNK